MAEKVVMLALSPTMETGTIARWLKKEGDEIRNGDIICEVETDKATMEYESVNEGVLLRIIVGEGEGAGVGRTIAVVGEKGEDITAILAEKSGAGDEGTGPAGGEKKEKGEKKKFETATPPAAAAEAETPAGAGMSGGGAPPEGVKASPLAREIARSRGIDLGAVAGTGPEGRIIKRDLEKGFPASAGLAPAAGHGRETVPVSPKRKIIAQRLSESMYSAPHYYLRKKVAVDELFEARKRLNRGREEKVSLNGFLIKFAAEALKRHPYVNSSWRDDVIERFGSADIGLAVSQEDGLITPVVRDCWNRGILDIDGELKTLIEKALANKLKPEEYTGATFTITNLGSFGIHEFTAIINPPGSAILAVGQALRETAAGPGDSVVFRTAMTLTLSCDHRVIDGARGAEFLNDLGEMIEHPVSALY